MPYLALVFKALADESRQRILEMLTQREMSAGEIAAAFQMAQPSVSHHLAVLKRAELVICHRQGQQVIYALNYSRLDDCWDHFFSRLLQRTPRVSFTETQPGRATTEEER